MKRKVVIVIDMQKDFVTGCLGSKEAQAIVPNMVQYLRNFDGDIVFTRDTHTTKYMNTQEGAKLPVIHCVKDTDGWNIIDELNEFITNETRIFDKPTFGSVDLVNYLVKQDYEEIEFVGVCTGICVISNATMTKAFLPETPIVIHNNLCACVTPDSHNTAIKAMELLQMNIK